MRAAARGCSSPHVLTQQVCLAAAAYLNLEPVHGPYAGESASVDALRASGVARVVVGLLHPLAGLPPQLAPVAAVPVAVACAPAAFDDAVPLAADPPAAPVDPWDSPVVVPRAMLSAFSSWPICLMSALTWF